MRRRSRMFRMRLTALGRSERASIAKRHRVLWLLAVLPLVVLPLFGHLGDLPLRKWDESRNAVNAYEMVRNGDYLVTHFAGEPDLVNSKPPLLIWCQVAMMKCFGINELSVRLPSALAGFATCILLLYVAERYLSDLSFGVISVLVLVTSPGYVNYHGTRTGDYDAMLTLFMAGYGLFFFLYLESAERRYLYWAFVSMILALLTKGSAALLFMPGLLLWAVRKEQSRELVFNRQMGSGLLCVGTIVAVYYGMREANSPGYLSAVWQNEWASRYGRSLGGPPDGPLYYVAGFVPLRLPRRYAVLILLAIGAALKADRLEIRRLATFAGVLSIQFLLAISLSQWNAEWYDMPMYPFLALLCGATIHWALHATAGLLRDFPRLLGESLGSSLLVVLLLKPYYIILWKTQWPTEFFWNKEEYRIASFLKDTVAGQHEINGYILALDGYQAHTLFYVKLLRERGQHVEFKHWTKLVGGDKVIADQQGVREYIEEHYAYELLGEDQTIRFYRIDGSRAGLQTSNR